jgi:Zn-dependent protease
LEVCLQIGTFSSSAMEALMVLIPMILSLTVHEFAHAWMAKRLGDSTAESMGRLTLNPLAHADPVGTVLMPFGILLLNGLMGGAGRIPFFGFAKPTPVNPNRFHRHISVRRGSLWVAAVGPLSNFIMACLCVALLAVSVRTPLQGAAQVQPLQQFLLQMVMINVALGVFNLIPLRPLDGHQVVANLLSPRQALHFEEFNARYGNYVLWGIILFAGRLIMGPINFLAGSLLAVAGLA